jgi:hypothetical protein
MTSLAMRSGALNVLVSARRVADYAERLGVDNFDFPFRAEPNHLGAIIADCVLQAGVNYRTVVKTRIDRILVLFPEAATMSGTAKFVEPEAASEFLLWRHYAKIGRFVSLVCHLQQYEVENTRGLRVWLQSSHNRDTLLHIPGIGPKTVDYLCCLAGLDFVAVDRHIRSFARDAGVETSDYEQLKQIVSYAADLLGMPRRSLDFWIWTRISQQPRAAEH